MKVIDKGHDYEIDNYDGIGKQRITFMKREGANYPFNVGHYKGTNLQEVIRVLIDRVKYLNTQISCDENSRLIYSLRKNLLNLESRTARRHGWDLNPQVSNIEIEDIPVCKTCGHIQCKGH